MSQDSSRPAPPTLRAVLIDLDGTLMDTAPDLALAANGMRAEFALSPLATARIASFVGKGADVLVQRALTDRLDGAVDAATFARGRAAFFARYHAVNGTAAVVFPGVADALTRLQAAGLVLACVTNKPREFTLPLLARTGLAAHFSVMVAGDDVREKKPHPALLLAALRQLNMTPLQVVMIGDSNNDALASAAAGLRAILVETGYNEGEPVASLAGRAGVDVIVPTLAHAAEVILQRLAM